MTVVAQETLSEKEISGGVVHDLSAETNRLFIGLRSAPRDRIRVLHWLTSLPDCASHQRSGGDEHCDDTHED